LSGEDTAWLEVVLDPREFDDDQQAVQDVHPLVREADPMQLKKGSQTGLSTLVLGRDDGDGGDKGPLLCDKAR
jgi:hypothetical protein